MMTMLRVSWYKHFYNKKLASNDQFFVILDLQRFPIR